MARVPGGRRLIFGGSDFQVYDVDSGAGEAPNPRFSAGTRATLPAIAVVGDKKAVSGGYDGKLIWWGSRDGLQAPDS